MLGRPKNQKHVKPPCVPNHGNRTWEVEKHDFGKKVFAFVEIDFHVAIEPPRETLTGMQWRS